MFIHGEMSTSLLLKPTKARAGGTLSEILHRLTQDQAESFIRKLRVLEQMAEQTLSLSSCISLSHLSSIFFDRNARWLLKSPKVVKLRIHEQLSD